MKTKFISVIASVAVILGLMLVPAALSTAVSGNPANEWAFEIQNDAVTKVTPGSSFTVDIAAVQLSNEDSDGWEAYVRYNTTYLSVTGIDIPATLPAPNSMPPDKYPWPGVYGLANPDYNNTEGILYIGYSPAPGSPKLNATFVLATIHFDAKAVEGTSYLNFVDVDTFHTTKILLGSTEVQKWSSFVNGTVMIGSPVLTVDVSPAGKGDVKVDGVIAAPYPANSSWTWDEVVPVEAVDSTAGWEFDSWTGDVASASARSTTVTMSDAKTVVANFVELPCDLDVDPNVVDLTARYGGYEDNDTVTISNLGGHTLCWQLGEPPTWTVGDNWSYWNTYDSVPNATSGGFDPYPNPYYANWTPCSENNTLLVLTVTGEDADNYIGVADWPITDPQRTTYIEAYLTYAALCMHNATVAVDKCTLDYVSQLANLTIWLAPGESIPGQALVTWDYDGCHGWPYYAGKSWTYNMTIVDAIHTVVVPAQAMVTAGPMAFGGFDDVYVITHATPDMGGTVFMQQFWSDTARNFVFQWDGGTFNAPPVDVRSLTGFSVSAPAPAAPPAWLSFDKTHGALGIGESDALTVTANTSGLEVGSYPGSFTISGCCGIIQEEIVTVDFVVTPATTIDVIRELPADALDFDAEYPGDSFWVYVNFAAPVKNFTTIGLTDFAPAGWLVETDNSWCTPAASANKSNYNKVEYSWFGPYDPPRNFTAKYRVTIPATVSAGMNEWPSCMETCPACGESSNINNYCAWAEYWFGPQGPFESSICGDYQKIVTVPGCVVGETRDVNAKLLDTVTVVLSENPAELGDEPEDSDSSSIVPVSSLPEGEHMGDAGGNFTTWYENCADDTGNYYQVASKYCYYTINTSAMPSPHAAHPDYINWSTPELLAAGYRMDFEGNYGLICKGADMSYAMTSVNHWLFVPIDGLGTSHPEWQLDSWKAMESIHSWQYPCGCGCC